MTYADWVTKATPEERGELSERIAMIIGTKEEARAAAKDRTERIQAGVEYNKAFEKLALAFINGGEKALAMNFTKEGCWYHGTTASGKRWSLQMNGGYTRRSRYCGTLYIEGEGCLFTSGRLDKTFEYILNN